MRQYSPQCDNTRRLPEFQRGDRVEVERLGPGDALLAIYILDESVWALPTQQMAHRSVTDADVLFEELPGSIRCSQR
jgi:hypothetical protein